jgi:hypothetical protein
MRPPGWEQAESGALLDTFGASQKYLAAETVGSSDRAFKKLLFPFFVYLAD